MLLVGSMTLFVLQCLLQLLDLNLQVLDRLLMLIDSVHDLLVGERHTACRRVVEDSGQRVIVELLDRIELVIVTAGTRTSDA